MVYSKYEQDPVVTGSTLVYDKTTNFIYLSWTSYLILHQKGCFHFQFSFNQVRTHTFSVNISLDFIILVSHMCTGFQLSSHGHSST